MSALKVCTGALLLAIFASSALEAQQPPAIEVASIKRHVGERGPLPANVIWLPGDRLTATGLTLAELIRSAYVGHGIQLMNQIAGGPGWITVDRVDIVGTLTGISTGRPEDANRQRQAALQALLADRFKLTLHADKRELAVFDLVLADKGGRLGPQLTALPEQFDLKLESRRDFTDVVVIDSADPPAED